MFTQYLASSRFFLKQRALPRISIALGLVLYGCLSGAASAQSQPNGVLGRLGEHTDLAVLGVGEFTGNTEGPVVKAGAPDFGTVISLSPSTTLGALVTLRYTKSPFVGGEFNYGYARYSENFNNLVGSITVNPTIQTKASEVTFGYVAHIPKEFFGVSPFASAGGGIIKFTPTSRGGQGFPAQGRGTYYFAAGAEAPVLGPHFGLRVQYRQVFFAAPDFFENYFTTGKHTSTAEPSFGFYLHF